MIITKTPFRMSFFGGGTDLPSFFREYGGSVISTTFDKYCYITVRHLPPFFDYTTEVVYSELEQVRSIDAIRHPAVRNAMKLLDMHELRITYDADLPARSGLGTSSAFSVGLLNAFHALKGKCADRRTLAEEAIYLERTLCDEAGGWQDQIAASYGGLNRIDFAENSFTVTRLSVSEERKRALEQNLMLFYTEGKRNSFEVQSSNLRELKTHIREYREILSLVEEAQRILLDDESDLDDFGRLLDETWRLKSRAGSLVTTEKIDALYKAGREAGALGGKLLGAGGGGFLLFYISHENREALLRAMEDHFHVPFRFEENGTSILYNAPEYFDCIERREP